MVPKILLVDDNDLNLIVCEELLGDYDVEVFSAASGKDALKLAKKHKFDMAFLDHIMPVMDGPETCRKLRALGGKYAEIPIVSLTGNDTEQYRELYAEVGVSAALVKPLEPDTLEVVMSRFLGANVKKSGVKKSSEEPAWFKELSEYARFDVRRGLQLMGGSYESFAKTLDAFCMQSDVQIPNMDALSLAGNLKDYAVQAHSFKSSLNNIGASGISEKARELETRALADDAEFVAREHAALEWGVTTVAKIIRRARSSAAAAKPAGSSAALGAELIKAADAADDFDTETAVKITESLAALSYGAEIDAKLARLSALLGSYEFDKFAEEARAAAEGV